MEIVGKYLFVIIALVHGQIHLMGAASAFGYNNKNTISATISRPAGYVWILSDFLFVFTIVLYLFNISFWAWIALISVIVSQLLIFSVWKQARFGTVVNILMLLVAIAYLAEEHFYRNGKKEIESLLNQPLASRNITDTERIKELPVPVQKYLLRAGVTTASNIQFVRLKQLGEMRSKENGRWMSFTATQYFETSKPQFVWQAKINSIPFLPIAGRDIFKDGEGQMKIQLLSLFTLASAGPDPKTNSSAMIRFLAEMSWFPAAFLNEYVHWEAIDSNSAKVIMTYKGTEAKATMKFDENGDLKIFEAMRYKSNSTESMPELWQVEILGFKDFQGFRIPYKSKVIWKLENGDFHWANFELTDLEFNNRKSWE